jgi:hypothetical protein
MRMLRDLPLKTVGRTPAIDLPGLPGMLKQQIAQLDMAVQDAAEAAQIAARFDRLSAFLASRCTIFRTRQRSWVSGGYKELFVRNKDEKTSGAVHFSASHFSRRDM